MANLIIKKNFFDHDSHEVAKKLLGQVLIRKFPNGELAKGIIVEVEVYQGFADLASHAAKKITKRNQVMYGEPGYYYIYLIYGMYHCLNIVTEEAGYPAAILIRALKPISDTRKSFRGIVKQENFSLANGPGKLCRWLEIDTSMNNTPVDSSDLFLEISQPAKNIISCERVGVSYSGDSAKLPWRYYIKDSPYVSKV